MIRDNTIAVIVPYGRARTLISRIGRTGHFDRNTLRRLQRFMVNLRPGPGGEYQTFTDLGALQPLLRGSLDLPVLADWCYNPSLGIVIKDLPPEDLIV